MAQGDLTKEVEYDKIEVVLKVEYIKFVKKL